jgi:hypothetical protein
MSFDVRAYDELYWEADTLKDERDACLRLMCRVARGEQTLQAMGEWIYLMYPQFRKSLPLRMRVKP